MIYDRAKIENTLNHAKKIIEEHPELSGMHLDAVVDELDDGSEKMLHDRWGVAAWLVIYSVQNWNLPDLVKHLASVESGVLTYEYVGYPLHNRYGISMEEMLLEADRQDNLESIVRYTSASLMLMVAIDQQYILPLLKMLERRMDSDAYSSIISSYADGIASCKSHLAVATILGELKSRAQYDLISQLRKSWYNCDANQANGMLEQLLQYSGEWNKKAAIDFWGTCLYYDLNAFEKYVPIMESLYVNNEEYRVWIVSVFLNYVAMATEKGADYELLKHVIEHLNGIPADTTRVKYSFLEALRLMPNTTDELQKILYSIISIPFEENKCPLRLLDWPLKRVIKNVDWKSGIELMLELFRVNKYRQNYSDYFNGLASVIHELSKHSANITAQALRYMLAADLDQLFFGLGLFIRLGNPQKLHTESEGKGLLFSTEQLIRLIKVTLYYSFDSLKTCHTAFRLLAFHEETPERYIAFCMDEVYGNYPGTMLDISKQYLSSEINAQILLAQNVIRTHDQDMLEYKQIMDVKDLQPSFEHQVILRRAQQKQQKQISKIAKERSFWTRFFGSKVMKYGVRSAHIMRRLKGEKHYQVVPYHQIEHRIELSAFYIQHPVEYDIKKAHFLNEVIGDAIDH